MEGCTNYKVLNANVDFIILFTPSSLHTLLMVSFHGMKSQSIAYLLGGVNICSGFYTPTIHE